MNRSIFIPGLLWLLCARGALCQSVKYDRTSLPEISLEEIIAGTDDESRAYEIYENLTDLADNPLDINNATGEDLARLYYLNDFQIYCILDYHESYGDLLSLNELYLIPGLREDLVRHILPYVTTGTPSLRPVSSSKHLYLKHRLIVRTLFSWPPKAGFDTSFDSTKRFRGPPVSRLMKYELKTNKNIQAGFTCESDPGEPFEWTPERHAFDFNSAYLEADHAGPFRKIVAGDFRYESGCGLINGGGRNGKSPEVILKQKNAGIRHYSSAGESGFRRGIAAMLVHGKLSGRCMFSRVKRPAIVMTAGHSSREFTSLDRAGLYRNKSEEALKHNIKETQAATGIGWQNGTFALNYNFLAQHFNLPYRHRILTDRFSATRDDRLLLYHSLDYSFRRSLFLVSGEAAIDKQWNPAFITNLTAWLHPLLTISMNYRYYAPKYMSLNASAFSESDVRNEEGFYFGLEAYPFRALKLSFYLDQYRFPWLKYNGIAPERGHDVLLKLDITPGKSCEIVSLLKYEEKETGVTRDHPGIGSTGHRSDLRWTSQVVFTLNDNMRFKTKIDYRRSVDTTLMNAYNGIFMSQDIGLHLWNDRIALNLRYALFDSPDWSTRIYAYENDLLYRFSTPAFYRRGSRWYMSGKIKLVKRADLWFKYAATSYTMPYISGTGPDKREGMVYRELGMEVVVRL